MKRAVILALVLIVVFGGGWWIDRSREETASTLSGFFESQPTLASSRIGGRVTQILVKEGDAVKKGQPLLKMEDKSLHSSLEAQEANERQAQAAYAETVHGNRPEDIAKQKDDLRAAEANYAKLVNGPRPAEIAQARAKLGEAKDQYRKMLAGPRPEEVASARAAAGQALERLRESQRGLTIEERAELKARLDEAIAAETLAKKDLDRSQVLYQEGAIAREQFDTETSTYQQAQGRTKDAAEAYRRAQEGTPKEELAEAREAYKQALAQLDLVLAGNRKEDIEAAREEVVSAAQDLKLLLEGSRKEDIAAAKAQVEEAKEQLLELEQGSRPEDVAKASAARQEASLEAKSSAQNLQEREIYAPFDGTVDRVLVADGDLIAANAPVIQLSNPADIWVRVYLPEDQLSKVKVGDRADLAVDGISGDVSGLVESIDHNGQFTPANLQSPDERAKQVFGIRIRLARTDLRVKPGMYVTVRKVGSWP